MNTKFASLLLLGGLLTGFIVGRGTVSENPSAFEGREAAVGDPNPPPRRTTVNRSTPVAATGAQTDSRSAADVAEEIRRLLRSTSTIVGNPRISNLIYSVATADLPELAALLRNESRLGNDYMLLSALLGRWAMVDPGAAMAFAESIRRTDLSHRAITAVMSSWVAADLDGATTYFHGIKQKTLRHLTSNMIVAELTRRDPAAALAFVKDYKLERPRFSSALSVVFTQWANTDARTALHAATNSLVGPDRRKAVEAMVSGLAMTDPEAAWELSRSL